jgi:RNA recognition motif-containing protein
MILVKSGYGALQIENLEESVDDFLLFKTFYNFGEITFCEVFNNVGYTRFRNQMHVAQIKKEFNDSLLKDQRITIKDFVSPRKHKFNHSHSSIFIKNLPRFVQNETHLQELFEQYGIVNFVQ